MSIELREITMRNFNECIGLEVNKAQKNFVASNMYSLAESKADGISQPRTIYNGDEMVGFVMYDYEQATGMSWVSRLMIDRKHQGKGYGRKAMDIVVETLKSYEGCSMIRTSFEPNNSRAKKLYLSLGFKLNGEQIDGEDVCIMKINEDRAEQPYEVGKQVARNMEKNIMRKAAMDYLLYLPWDYTWEKEWPLVVFLHGAGERGNDLELVKKHGPPMMVEGGKQFPFILVSPQCPEYLWWPDNNREIKEIINDITGKYTVNLNRIYITGLSMGGFGTFSMVKDYPGLFAAAVPICGGIRGNGSMDKARNVPFWIFHGDDDKTVPADMSKKAADSILKAGGNAKLTIYPGTGHNSWSVTYENQEVYDWMMAQRKNDEI